MKHTSRVTAMLILLFVTSQVVGLGALAISAGVEQVGHGLAITYEDTALGERPAAGGVDTVLYIMIGVGIATLFLLALIKYKLVWFLKLWFFAAIAGAMTAALETVLPVYIALPAAIVLAGWKMLKRGPIIHNFTEILIYAGIGVLIVPMFDAALWAGVLLILISLYDAFAVWKSKHMVKMAEFQTQANMFAGLHLTYNDMRDAKKSGKASTKKVAVKKVPAGTPVEGEKIGTQKSAVLGGGDIAFPLILVGGVYQDLLLAGQSTLVAYSLASIVILGATLSLLLLFTTAKKDTFYPAMPFLTAGCFTGLLVVSIVNAII